MAIQFPQNPTDGQVYPDYDAGDAPLENGLVYYWSAADGAWQVSCDASDEYVKRAGDNMSGYLFLRDNVGQTQLATDEAHATTKAYVDRRFTEIEEELEAIAPSVQRGTWYYNGTEPAVNRNPGPGKFYLQKNDGGNQTVVSTYGEANQLVIHNENSAGELQTFSSASYQDILSLYNVEDDGFVLGEIQSIADFGGYQVITFVSDTSLLEPVDTKLARLNIFNPPSGGNVSDYLSKINNDQIGLADDRDITYKVACSNGTNRTGLIFKLDSSKDRLQIIDNNNKTMLSVSADTGTAASGTIYLRDLTYLSYGQNSFQTRLWGKLNLGYNGGARVEAKRTKSESDRGTDGLVGPGTAGQVLKSNGDNGPVYWGDASATFRHGTSTNPSLSTGEGYFNTDQRVLYIGL
jgi:hypothetical protein